MTACNKFVELKFRVEVNGSGHKDHSCCICMKWCFTVAVKVCVFTQFLQHVHDLKVLASSKSAKTSYEILVYTAVLKGCGPVFLHALSVNSLS